MEIGYPKLVFLGVGHSLIFRSRINYVSIPLDYSSDFYVTGFLAFYFVNY